MRVREKKTWRGGLLTAEEMDQLMDVAEEIAKTVEEPKKIEAPSKKEKEE